MSLTPRIPAWASAGVCVLAIALLTLSPSGGSGSSGPILCVACGERGLADAILNIILFLPLGAALLALLHSVPRVTLAAAVVSLSVEIAQIWIPGRDSNPGDLLFNITGAALGAGLLLVVLPLLHGAARRRRLVAAVLLSSSLTVLTVGAVLLAPYLPRITYWGQWNPRFEHAAWYRGPVLDARLGSMHIASGRLDDSEGVRSRLRAGDTLHITFAAGPPVHQWAPLFGIADGGPSSIRQVGIDNDDAVFRFRTLSSAVRLDQPSLRVPGALAGLSRGDTVVITIHPRRDGFCLAVDGRSACDVAYRLADTWRVLYSADYWPAWLTRVAGLLWLTGVVTPAGIFLASGRERLLAGCSVLAGILIIPVFTPVAAAGVSELYACLAGIALGALIRWLLLRPARHSV